MNKCVAATDGASVTPTLRINVAVTEDDKQPPEQANLRGEEIPDSLFNGAVTAKVDRFGLIKLDVKPRCGRQATYYSQK